MDSEKKYSDKDLVTAMQAVRVKADSDIKAFEQIFHKYYPMLRNFIAGLLKNPAEAEDIAQNCFMKLWFNRCSLNPEQSLKNYLFVMARNEAFNVLRSRRLQNVPLSIRHDGLSPLCAVDDWLNFSETNAILQKNIEMLPPQRRAIFKMSRYIHMSNMEIAVKLNISVRTVEKHIELALRDLRKGMDVQKVN
ncbi:MAG: RNA polymerase sigma-70 factor [Bacteroidetes bacterium]|uniref:RNA polymerase sigma-70 factor n=1 Tax=Candidatus Cryptobacteroides merdigallinarum TaxID=2840770 RepID=A0A9D9ENA2_9BACT|nr:RNA polymerase sigma-70 factor [Candidatus Cryptobacteroides merdigallinarum]